jgi:TetR/AcrR family transcriptional regulator, mexCD-oprJ operon repressor
VSHQPPEPAAPTRPRRADAQRSIERIIDAAVDCLSVSPEASMVDIARHAGVVRATIYVHFPTREALLDAVTERAFSEVAAVIAAAEPERGDPAAALARVVAATWRTLGRYHALVAINTGAQTHEELHHRHGSVLSTLMPLIERGQAAGDFRADAPATWHLAMLMALIHAGSGELRASRVREADAETALVATVLGAVSCSSPRSGVGSA